MKNKILKISLLTLLSTLAIGASACGASPSSSSSEPQSSSSSLPEWHDYTQDSAVRLALDYEGREFFTEGIEEVSLKTCIDGDTAHFNTSSGTILKARFYGIDTPESTGKIQPWGKAASKYTKAALEKAAQYGTIVVSSPRHDYGAPEPDSTGERYVSLIWINQSKKDAAYNELTLLNLAIVQDGLSWVKSLSVFPEYTDTFMAAESQAQAYKLKLHSDDPDPDFNYGGYEDVTLLDIKKEVVACLEDSTRTNKYDNAKVRIQGTVAGYTDKILYLQNYYTEAESGVAGGVYAGINIFTGMGSVPSKFTTKNAYIQVCGVCTDSENFGFQMSDVSLPTVSYSENDGKVLIKPEDNTDERKLNEFSFSKAQFETMISAKDYSYMYCAMSCNENLVCSSAFVSTGGDITLKFSDTSLQAYVTFAYCGDPEHPNNVWNKEEDFVGKTFTLKGVYVPHKTASGKMNFQINPTCTEELVWIQSN